MVAKPEYLRVRKSRAKGRRRKIAANTKLSKAPATIELLPEVRGNSIWSRMWVECQQRLASDRGGLEACSESQKLLIQHASVIHVELVIAARDLALKETGGTDKERQSFNAGVGAFRRCLEDLGIQRSALDITCLNGVAIEEAPSPPPDRDQVIKSEMERRALEQGSDALLAQLWKANEQRDRDDEDAGPRFIVEYAGAQK
jgi:hypothetical protein